MKLTPHYVKQQYEKDRAALEPMYKAMLKDLQFKLGDHWPESVKAELDAAGKPHIVVNNLKKMMDTIEGYERQNRSKSRALPREGGDEIVADVLSGCLFQIAETSKAADKASAVFADQATCGLSWFVCVMDYSRDPFFGDVQIKHERIGSIFPSAQFVEKDLSDCDHITYVKDVNLDTLINHFPKKAKELEFMKGRLQYDSIQDERRVYDPYGQDTIVTVYEYWYYVYEPHFFLFENPYDMRIFKGNSKELQIEIARAADSGKDLQWIKRDTKVLKVFMCAGDVELYDGLNPYGVDIYPFIPAFGFYNPSAKEWIWRLEGALRQLEDIALEGDKRRSQILDLLSSTTHLSWLIEEGAVDDEEPYKNAAGNNMILKYNRGYNPPVQKTGVPLDQSIVQVEQMFRGDELRIGPNADMLGLAQDKDAPLGLSRLRQQQGLMSLQQLFDNFNYAKARLGELIIAYVTTHYPPEKIRRILGDTFPFPTQEERENMKQQIELQKQQLAANIQQRQLQLEQMRVQDPEKAQDMMDDLMMEVRQMQAQIEAFEKNILVTQIAEMDFWENFKNYASLNYYDVVIDETTDSPTYRASASMFLTEIAKSGVVGQIDPTAIIKLAPIPDHLKKEIIDGMQAQQQQSFQFSQQQMDLQRLKLQADVMSAIAGMQGKADPAMIQQMLSQFGGK